jgi:hypothetical protein
MGSTEPILFCILRYIFKEEFKMEVKFDLAEMIKSMVFSQAKGYEKAISEIENLLKSAREGLETSYHKLEEAKAEDNKKNVFVIEAYISWLKSSIENYEMILDGYVTQMQCSNTAVWAMNKAGTQF